MVKSWRPTALSATRAAPRSTSAPGPLTGQQETGDYTLHGFGVVCGRHGFYLQRMRWTLLSLLLTSALSAQTLSVRNATTSDGVAGADELAVIVGDTLTIEIVAELGALPASGIALYLSVPAQGLAWLSGNSRPFRRGPLFQGGVEFANGSLSSDQSWGVADDEILLSYAVVMGPGTAAERSRSGAGVIATLRAVCTGPMAAGQIGVFDNAVHQTRVVLADGRTELPAATENHLELTATIGGDLSSVTETLSAGTAIDSQVGSWGTLKKQQGQRQR